MELEKFKRLKNFNLFQETDRGGKPWSVHEKFAALTKYIDYRCDFKDSFCKEHKHKRGRYKKEKGRNIGIKEFMCCCRLCKGTRGYLGAMPNNDDAIRKRARYFNDSTGFWRLGKGCILPRKYRSATCLGHTCSELKKYEYFCIYAIGAPAPWIIQRWNKLEKENANSIEEVIDKLERIMKQGG